MSEHEPTDYGREFYEWTDQAALTAAEIVVPTVLDMVDVTSVVDVGCGTGAWLRAFVDRGVTDVLGIDTDRVPPDLLKIGRDRYMTADLAHPPTVGRNFDLAVSVEVAEHLPEEAADRFVAFLCSLAPVLLFSAAIPRTGGRSTPQRAMAVLLVRAVRRPRFRVAGRRSAADLGQARTFRGSTGRTSSSTFARPIEDASPSETRSRQTARTADGVGSPVHVHVVPAASRTQTRNAAVAQRRTCAPSRRAFRRAARSDVSAQRPAVEVVASRRTVFSSAGFNRREFHRQRRRRIEAFARKPGRENGVARPS